MVLKTRPSEFWAEPRLVLSPTDTMKAARIGGMAFGLHLLLADVEYEDLFAFPSPFFADDSFKET